MLRCTQHDGVVLHLSSKFEDAMPNVDAVGELMGAESGSLHRRKSSEVRRSGLLRFSSCYEVIQAKKVNSCSNKRML